MKITRNMEIGTPFRDINLYNDSMGKSLEDKLFFLPHLPECEFNFIDFGCADGRLLGYLYTIFEKSPYNHHYFGYDCSESMIELAKSSFGGEYRTKFTTSWNDIMTYKMPGIKSVLILSSVIHEVYSYAKSEKEVEDFWCKVTQSGFDYIVVRDMMPGPDMSRPTDPHLMKKLEDRLIPKCIHSMKNDFVEIHGPLDNNKNFIHFLLKYRWRVNWDREVHENYFPIDTNEFLQKMMEGGRYNIEYLERFRVPFLDECIKKDFDIKLNDFTHIKAVFSKTKI